MTPEGTSKAWQSIRSLRSLVFTVQHGAPVRHTSRRDAENGWCLSTARPQSYSWSHDQKWRCCFPTPRLVVSYVFLHLIFFKGCEWLASEISHMKYPHSQATKSAPCMIIHPVKHSWVEVWEIACKETSQCPRFHTSHRFLSIPLAFGAPCRPRAGWIAAFAASFSSISFCLIIDFSFQPKISGARISRNPGTIKRYRVSDKKLKYV